MLRFWTEDRGQDIAECAVMLEAAAEATKERIDFYRSPLGARHPAKNPLKPRLGGHLQD